MYLGMSNCSEMPALQRASCTRTTISPSSCYFWEKWEFQEQPGCRREIGKQAWSCSSIPQPFSHSPHPVLEQASEASRTGAGLWQLCFRHDPPSPHACVRTRPWLLRLKNAEAISPLQSIYNATHAKPTAEAVYKTSGLPPLATPGKTGELEYTKSKVCQNKKRLLIYI